MKSLVTGATGFIGPRLLRLLRDPIILSRDPERAKKKAGTLGRTGDSMGFHGWSSACGSL